MKVYLGLGSNLGDREANLVCAIDYISAKVQIEKISSIYETEPVGYDDQPFFFNAVISGITEVEAHALLRFVKKIEEEMGRVPTFPNGPRIIDIDILLYENTVVNTTELTIPHPRLSERAFVLVPLAEIAPQLILPGADTSIIDLLCMINKKKGIVKRDWKGKKYV